MQTTWRLRRRRSISLSRRFFSRASQTTTNFPRTWSSKASKLFRIMAVLNESKQKCLHIYNMLKKMVIRREAFFSFSALFADMLYKHLHSNFVCLKQPLMCKIRALLVLYHRLLNTQQSRANSTLVTCHNPPHHRLFDSTKPTHGGV